MSPHDWDHLCKELAIVGEFMQIECLFVDESSSAVF